MYITLNAGDPGRAGALFLETSSSTAASEANVRHVRAFASCLRVALYGGDKEFAALVDTVRQAGADVDLLAAAEFAERSAL
jgi:hypothetical protein